MCGSGSMCGSAACGCDDTTVLAYVGPGGNYRQDTSYAYVGAGSGDFDIVNVPSGCSCSPILACIPVMGILTLLLLYTLLSSAGTTTTTYYPVQILHNRLHDDSVSELYDCDAGFDNWQRGWSIGKKSWCCDHHHKGCAIATTSNRFDCLIHGQPATVNRWTPAHKSWCCHHYGAGCVPVKPLPSPDPFNCAIAPPKTWGLFKRKWCCKHHHICNSDANPPPVPATTSFPYDCNAGYANWKAGWSIGKKGWCCAHGGRGCPISSTTTTSCPWNCDEGFSNWAKGWSEPKKQFCCHKFGRGCTPR